MGEIRISGYSIVDYHRDIFYKSTYIKISDSLYDQGINLETDIKLYSPDLRRIYINYTVLDMINSILNNKGRVFFFVSEIIPELVGFSEGNIFISTYGYERWQKFHMGVIKSILRYLPMCGNFYNLDLNDLKNLSDSDGEFSEVKNRLRLDIYKCKKNNHNKNISKSRDFINKYRLEFVDKSMFSKLSTMSLLY